MTSLSTPHSGLPAALVRLILPPCLFPNPKCPPGSFRPGLASSGGLPIVRKLLRGGVSSLHPRIGGLCVGFEREDTSRFSEGYSTNGSFTEDHQISKVVMILPPARESGRKVVHLRRSSSGSNSLGRTQRKKEYSRKGEREWRKLQRLRRERRS
jgi:hypothetical protein